ncbi:uncharacterized protein LOC118597893, partial [Oryzias melastigma]|uniref:uncharacterized protein LOC118597893 n=1 Tax=Oryzias melastigma TaxID=30732 RepID=UPI00168D4152
MMSNSLAVKKMSLDHYPSFEHHTFVFNNPPILCITVYRTQKSNTGCIEDFSDFLASIHISFSIILIKDDFNLHVDRELDYYATQVMDLLTSLDFMQHVMQLTHKRGHTFDLVISYGLPTSVSTFVDLAVSDHYCVLFNSTGFIKQKTSVGTVKKCFLTLEVVEKCISSVHSDPPLVLPAPCDLILESFNKKLRSSLNSVAPLKTKKIITKSTHTWRTAEIKLFKKTFRATERHWRKYKLEINYRAFQNLLKLYNQTLKQARNSYFANIISKNKNKPRVLFSTIESSVKSYNNKNSIPASASLYEDFADHFWSKIYSVRSSVLNYQKSLFIENDGLILPEEALDSFDLVEATTLCRVFSQVNPTTCFLDPIPTSLFKSFYGSFESEILNIINCSLQTGVFPTAFKTA